MRILPCVREAVAEPVDGFKFINGEIHATSNRVFRDQPRRLMRVFLHAQQRGLQAVQPAINSFYLVLMFLQRTMM
jgi:UTP:GlnB (protein PII) uridylyltransferase